MVLLDFKEKQFDGTYEVSEIQINIEGEIFRGMLYLPPESFCKPHPLVIYFHGFPQLTPLTEIIMNYKFVLDIGYAFIAFNFRGYSYSEGKISIGNQVSDALEIVQFVKKMAEKNIFDLNDINIVAHDFGAYIGLILCSKTKIINKLILISPILDLQRHVYNDEFIKTLIYINRFLPGNVQGIENVDDFIKMTKVELSRKEFQIREFIKKLKNRRLKIITGDEDKITPPHDVNIILQNSNINPEITLVDCMDHECIEENDIEKINNEIKNFLQS